MLPQQYHSKDKLSRQEIMDEICKWEKRLGQIDFSKCNYSDVALKNAEKIYGDIQDKIKQLRLMLNGL